MFDFDRVIERRNTHSSKWDNIAKLSGIEARRTSCRGHSLENKVCCAHVAAEGMPPGSRGWRQQ
jgi:hypothetical protein